jgi:hypothetical protein
MSQRRKNSKKRSLIKNLPLKYQSLSKLNLKSRLRQINALSSYFSPVIQSMNFHHRISLRLDLHQKVRARLMTPLLQL